MFVFLHCFLHGRPQAWASGGRTAPSWKCYKVFCALVVTVRSVDQLFMHHFYNFSSASPPDPLPGSIPGHRWGTIVSRPPDLPTPGKNPANAHDFRIVVWLHFSLYVAYLLFISWASASFCSWSGRAVQCVRLALFTTAWGPWFAKHGTWATV